MKTPRPSRIRRSGFQGLVHIDQRILQDGHPADIVRTFGGKTEIQCPVFEFQALRLHVSGRSQSERGEDSHIRNGRNGFTPGQRAVGDTHAVDASAPLLSFPSPS